jgi:branched-chain amino acid transport system permease protein
VLLTIWSGLVLGGIYCIVAVGLTIGMLPSGTLNLAQGAIVVTGTYVTYSFLAVHDVAIVACIAINLVVGAALGAACELLCVRPLMRRQLRGQENELVTVVGFSLAVIGAVGVVWGYEVKAVPFVGPVTPIRLVGVTILPVHLFVLATAIASAVAMHVWVRRTRWGRVCLAVAEDRDAASLRGVNVNLISLAGFAAAGAFGTVTAIVIGPITYALPAAANVLVLGGFVALVLGGRGNFLGTLYGGLVVGVASSLATRYLGGSYASFAVLAVLLATLWVRPSNVLATGTRHV